MVPADVEAAGTDADAAGFAEAAGLVAAVAGADAAGEFDIGALAAALGTGIVPLDATAAEGGTALDAGEADEEPPQAARRLTPITTMPANPRTDEVLTACIMASCCSPMRSRESGRESLWSYPPICL